MKRTLYIISVFSALICGGCQKEDDGEGSVQLTPETVKSEFEQGTAQTVIVSSGSWTMDGNYTWCTPSARSGKSGDKVTFTYSENTFGRDRAAMFKIRCGSSYCNFALLQDSGILEMNASLSLVSSADGKAVFNMNVVSPDDIGKFVKWGLRYSKDENALIESGTDVTIAGTPAEGDVEVTVDGLDNDVTYWFTGWLELADGTRMYAEDMLDIFIATPFEAAVEVSGVKAHQATLAYDVNIPGITYTGVCLDTKGDPAKYGVTINMEDGTVISEHPSFEFQTYKCGEVLAAGTTYYVCAFVKRTNGETSYGPVSSFTTMADPFDGWLKDDSYASDYSHFQSLSEYGPVKGAVAGSSAYITESASDTQTSFRSAWNTALTSYSSEAKYAALFSELVFLRTEDGKNVMQNIVWREGSVGENLPKNANPVGGFAYTWERDADGLFTFESNYYAPAAFVTEDNAAVKNQGMGTDEFAEVYSGASNKSDLNTVRDYWTNHKFFMDWGETRTFDGQAYAEILFCAEDDPSEVFRFNAACFGTGKYDPAAYGLSWFLYIGEGEDASSYDLSEISEGGYYRLNTWSLAGEKVRISRNGDTGYPAYTPTEDGKAKLVNDDSELYVVPAASQWANRCVISFSKAENICIAKDIFLASTRSVVLFPCGDQIDLTGTTITSDWNASGSYSYYNKNGGFFAPTDKLREPHIYRFNTTFKENPDGEGFKICLGSNFKKCIVSTVKGANPINTWCDAAYITSDNGDNDLKWKPDTNGKYTIELDLSAMKLRAVPRQ